MYGQEPLDFEERIAALLAADAHHGQPLHTALSELFDVYKRQRLQIDRYDWQLTRLAKIARIADRYQREIQQDNLELRQESLFDPLTGLANRRMLTDGILNASDHAQRRGEPFAIAMFDVDHFKQINDQYGHEAGDRALVQIAATLRDHTRSWDLCGRWGGEEFVLLLPNSGIDEAIPVVERLIEAIRQLRIEVDGEMLKVTASCGLSAYREGDALMQSLNRADAALLEAKRGGRDRSQIECAAP